MTYNTMKKLINGANARKTAGSWGEEEYSAYRESTQNKLDVFFAAGRLTEDQYKELTALWV